jgi:hypothetical protein
MIDKMAWQSLNDPVISLFLNEEINFELRRIFSDFVYHGRIRRDINGANGTSCLCVSDDILVTTILFSERTCVGFLRLRKLSWEPKDATYNADWNKVEQQLQKMWEAATTAAWMENIHGYTSWEVDRFQYGENSTLEPTTTSLLSNASILRR